MLFILFTRFTWWKTCNGNSGILWKRWRWHISHTSKTENFKSNSYYEGDTLKLIEVKGKVSAKRVLRLFLTSFRCLWSKSWTKSLDQQTLLLKLEWKTVASLFVIIKKKRIESYLQPAWLQMQCSGACFCRFLLM